MSDPKQVQLSLEQFPKESWAQSLVAGFNQFVVQTVAALRIAAPVYKVLSFTTGPTVSDSFPIAIQVDAPVSECRVGMILAGNPTGAVFAVAQNLSGGRLVNVTNITGLAANTFYSIRLALE